MSKSEHNYLQGVHSHKVWIVTMETVFKLVYGYYL